MNKNYLNYKNLKFLCLKGEFKLKILLKNSTEKTGLEQTKDLNLTIQNLFNLNKLALLNLY